MTTFNEGLEELKWKNAVSFRNIRQLACDCHYSLPQERQNDIYNALDRGKRIIDADWEDACNCYLKSYGKMHEAKLQDAYECLPKNFFSKEIEIYDWGCGQALATVCYFDFLKERRINQKITKITLIEPSIRAMSRGLDLIRCYTNTPITCIARKFDELVEGELRPSIGTCKLHLFSNILDVATFDMPEFTKFFQDTQRGCNYIVCVGPYYPNTLQRTAEFMTAVGTNDIYGVSDDPVWKRNWTRSMRVFETEIRSSDTVETIRQRIDEAKTITQYHAGYVLDSVSDILTSVQYSKQAACLLKSLSDFDVRSNKPLGIPDNIDPKWAVVNNIVTRGTPTIASLYLEGQFSSLFGISKENSDSVIHFESTSAIDSKSIFEALHIIEPRFKVHTDYNEKVLESTFEKDFIHSYLSAPGNEYLAQSLEPQRSLSSIIRIPDRRFPEDQRVDFALEIPYSNSDGVNAPTGFVVEIDGRQYHSGIFNRLADKVRDRGAAANGWETYRLKDINDEEFVANWNNNPDYNNYLSILKGNFSKSLSGVWSKSLQTALSPFAVARVQKLILEAIISGKLQMYSAAWRITIIERDVPCAVLAVEDLKILYEHLCELEGKASALPEIQLSIVSTKEFVDSPLHLGHQVHTNMSGLGKQDLCIDISMLLRDKIDNYDIDVEAETYYVARSAHYSKGQRTIYTSDCLKYRPLVEKDRSGRYVDVEEPKEHLRFFLQNIFRKCDFRQGQLPILSRSLSGETTIGLLPTGGGKSLTYQLSSVLQPGVTVIVDPLVSLMTDQYNGLLSLRIDACDYLNATRTGKDKSEVASKMACGCYLFVFMSPERFMIRDFRYQLADMTTENKVYFSYGVIDEVHCVSEWGHDFRPAYLHLGRNMSEFMRTKQGKPVPIIGLTATASFDVLADVERELTVPGRVELGSDAIVRPEEDDRPELTYEVVEVKADFNALREQGNRYILAPGVNQWNIKNRVASAKDEAAVRLIKQIPATLDELNHMSTSDKQSYDTTIPEFGRQTFFDRDDCHGYRNAGIIFCPHTQGYFGVKGERGVANFIHENSKLNLEIATFIGGANPKTSMVPFIRNEKNLMVATKAFGMGIDKPNVRYTINFTHPSSVESFVQEAGRAGRDRKNAIGYLMYEPTEYVRLTTATIRKVGGDICQEDYSILWNYKDRYILKDDIPEWCAACGMSDETYRILPTLLGKYAENEDKNVELFFHNGSFKGAEKEKTIMLEFTDGLLNVVPTNLLDIQGQLRERLENDDFKLRLNKEQNAVKVVSEENPGKQYGFIYLNNLHPVYTHIDYPEDLCRRICNSFIQILSAEANNVRDIAQWLNAPMQQARTTEAGIYSVLDQVSIGANVFITVSWSNQIEQDIERYSNDIISAINYIAEKEGVTPIEPGKVNILRLVSAKSFAELLDNIDKETKREDAWWALNGQDGSKCFRLRHAFNKRRDKSDTEKVIYRMCCIGLIEDVTIDYLSETYQLKLCKKAPGEYYKGLQQFLERYYTPAKAAKLMEDVPHRKGRREIDQCLGYLTEFVYSNTEKKRMRAIDDMRLSCTIGINKGRKALKEFIHLYFNSKYARPDYKIYDIETKTDLPYSLLNDTDGDLEFTQGESGPCFAGVIKKYINVLKLDDSGSEVNNAKHLYGASLLLLRTYPENAALNLLKAYCIVFLGIDQNNENLIDELRKSYINGFFNLYEHNKGNGITFKELYSIFEWFNQQLFEVARDNGFVNSELVDGAFETISVSIHQGWLQQFEPAYIKQ